MTSHWFAFHILTLKNFVNSVSFFSEQRGKKHFISCLALLVYHTPRSCDWLREVLSCLRYVRLVAVVGVTCLAWHGCPQALLFSLVHGIPRANTDDHVSTLLSLTHISQIHSFKTNQTWFSFFFIEHLQKTWHPCRCLGAQVTICWKYFLFIYIFGEPLRIDDTL